MASPYVIDANPIISALLGGSALRILLSAEFAFHTAQHTLFEAEKYISHLAKKMHRSEMKLFEEFSLFPIIAHQPLIYEDKLELADCLIGHRDSDDIHILALTLHLGYPLWTEDRDFDNLPGVMVYRTAALLAIL